MESEAGYVIRVDGLVKSFDRRRILGGVDLEVEQGESLVILGFSGSGKSLLMKHITGFIEPDQGTVEVLGHHWSGLSDERKQELRKAFGIVFQNAALFDSLTIEENLTLPLTLRKDLRNSPAEARTKALARLREVGLSEVEAQRQPVQISGGMQKRAAIARALAVEPQIIFYDEPTAGLDPQTAERISRLIRQVNDAHPETTSYTITHDYRCAAVVGDRILYLDKKSGTLRQILSAEELREMKRGGEEKDQTKRIEDHLEAFVDTRTTEVDDAPAGRRSLGVGAFLREEVESFLTTLGAMLSLLLEMGFPLRLRDFVERVFSVGVHSFPLVLGAGFFVGMTGMVQFYIGAGPVKELLPTPMPATLASALLKIISPLLVGVLLAGRVGSNVTAEIGSKGLLNQIEALESLAISPKQFLLAPIVWALVVTTPLMTLLCSFAGLLGGFLMWLSFGEPGSNYWAVIGHGIEPADYCYALCKSAVTGLLVGLVGYQLGTRNIRGTDDIAAAATRTVLICAILVVLCDFLISFFYTQVLGM